MEALAWALIVSCITGIGCGALGAGIATLFDAGSNRTISILLSFAAGLMLSIICFDFVPEALEQGEGLLHLLLVTAFIAAGAIIVGVLGRVVDKRAQKRAHCSALDNPSTPLGSEQLKIAGLVMAIAIAMHNLPAGVSIGGSFASPDGTMIVSGVMIAVLLGLHSIPETMSMAIPLIHSGMSKARTILIGAAIGTFILIGTLIGYAIGEIDAFWMSMCLAFASGAMLFVMFGEILPESFLIFHSKKPALAVLGGLIFGIVLIGL